MHHETNQWNATVGASDSTILGVNIGRRRLTVSPPSVGRVTIFFGRASVLDQGETLQAGTQARTFSYDDMGSLLCGEIHAIADAAGRLIGGVESFIARP